MKSKKRVWNHFPTRYQKIFFLNPNNRIATHNEDDPPHDDEEEGEVEEDVEDVVQLEPFPGGPLVEGGVDAHPDQERPEEEEDKVEEEHGVLDPGGDVGEVGGEAAAPAPVLVLVLMMLALVASSISAAACK